MATGTIQNLFGLMPNKKPSAQAEGREEYLHLFIEIQFVLLFRQKDW